MAVTQHKAQGLVPVACFVLAASDTRSVDTDSCDRAFATCSQPRGTLFRARDRQRRAGAGGRGAGSFACSAHAKLSRKDLADNNVSVMKSVLCALAVARIEGSLPRSSQKGMRGRREN